MKIAMVSPYSWTHPGGVNNHIKGLAGCLLRSGHEVTVVVPDGAEKPGATGVYSTPYGDFEVFSAGRSFPIPANGSVANIALTPGVGRRVRRLISGGGFDVVHIHEPLVPRVSTSAILAADCRLVGTFHAASEGGGLLYKVAGARYGRAFAKIDYRIAVSTSAEDLISRYFPGDYRIIPNGVETSRFNSFVGSEKKHEWKDEKLILFVGRDEPRKGLSVLLDAFESILEKVPDCRLLLVGSSIEENKVYSRLRPELREKVTVAGYVGDADLPWYYAVADVFCAPALGGESFGIILLESMAAGTPVVASNIAGFKDVIGSTGGGELFEAGSSESLARVLTGLLRDGELRRRLEGEGLEGVKRYSWDRLALEIESCYRR